VKPSKKVKHFSTYTCEKLGWYIYALVDPRNKEIFYIGKGKGNRVFQHAKSALTSKADINNPGNKIKQIREIISQGQDVETYIVRHGISSEKVAYETEATLIDFIKLSGSFKKIDLKNIVLNYRPELGLASTSTIESIYEAPKCPLITEPAVLFRVPKFWTPYTSAAEMYEITRGWWVLGTRREKADYAFSIHNLVIRAIYEIHEWRPRKKGDRGWEGDLGKKPRWGFSGVEATQLNEKYLGTSVKHLYKQGEQGVKYINC
jgi:hypothetical protein